MSHMLERLALALSFLIACGGEAIIDPPLGSGGASSSNASSSSGASSVAVSSSTGMVDDVCVRACTSLEACTTELPGQNCVEACRAANDNPGCGGRHEDFLLCSLGEIGSLCGSIPPTACATSLDEWHQCTDDILSEDCAVSPAGDCSCNAFLSPGVEYDQICTPGMGCQCFVGGQLVGGCEPNDELCGIANGCCAGIFFTAPF